MHSCLRYSFRVFRVFRGSPPKNPQVHSACARRQLSPASPPLNASWDILKTLSDPTRLRLLALILREELSVAELQDILGMGQSRISSQLALLRQAGFVTDRRDGKKAFYSLRGGLPARQVTLLRAACDSVADLPESAEEIGRAHV